MIVRRGGLACLKVDYKARMEWVEAIHLKVEMVLMEWKEVMAQE